MNDRDMRAPYGSREAHNDRDGDLDVRRPRIPTASDPYDYRYDAEPLHKPRPYRERNDESSFDSKTNISTPRTVKSTYSARSNLDSQGVLLDVERSRVSDRSSGTRTPRDMVHELDRSSRRSIVLDQDCERRVSAHSTSPFPSSPRGSGTLAGSEYGRFPAKNNQYGADPGYRQVDDYERRGREPFVLETRGKVEIIMPSRNLERSGGGGPRYLYETGRPREPLISTGNRDGRGAEITVIRRDYPPFSQLQQGYGNNGRRTPSRTRLRDHDTQDDWRIVESMRDTRITSDDTREGNRRSRAATHSSEDSYVMVSPERGQSQSLRSAFQQKDLPPTELRRRRSRSISFRDSEVHAHEDGDKRHERPGAEAQLLGYYLGRKAESDISTVYGSHVSSKEKQQSRYADDHYSPQSAEPYRDAYPPQRGYAPRSRSRSRRRRNDDKDYDDESYYSEKVDKTYRKKTEYY